MEKRPFQVTIIAWIFIATGILGLAAHLSDLKTLGSPPYENLWISLLRLVAIIGGAYMLVGKNWARWLCLAWMAFHVIIRAFDSVPKMFVHLALFSVFAYFLLRSQASTYFRSSGKVAA